MFTRNVRAAPQRGFPLSGGMATALRGHVWLVALRMRWAGWHGHGLAWPCRLRGPRMRWAGWHGHGLAWPCLARGASHAVGRVAWPRPCVAMSGSWRFACSGPGGMATALRGHVRLVALRMRWAGWHGHGLAWPCLARGASHAHPKRWACHPCPSLTQFLKYTRPRSLRSRREAGSARL
jgi:hypothetical protein